MVLPRRIVHQCPDAMGYASKNEVLTDAHHCQTLRARKTKARVNAGSRDGFVPVSAGGCLTPDHSHSIVAGGLLLTS